MPRYTQPVALVSVKTDRCYRLSCLFVSADGLLVVPERCEMQFAWAVQTKARFTAVVASKFALAAATTDGDVCFQCHNHFFQWYSLPCKRVCDKISVNCSTLYVLSDGELYRTNNRKELQRLHLCAVTTPAVVDIATCNTHTLALSDKKKVFAYGLNDCNQLGSLDLVQGFIDPADGIHGLVTVKSTVWCKLPGSLSGDMREIMHEMYGAEYETLVARQQHMRGLEFESVHVGTEYSLVVADGKVYSFGLMLGRPLDCDLFLERIVAAEVKFGAETRIKHVSAGAYSAHAICTKGCVYAWGMKTSPQLQHDGDTGTAAMEAVFSTVHKKNAAVVTKNGGLLELTQGDAGFRHSSHTHTHRLFSWHRFVEAKCLALCMAAHMRLGRASQLGCIDSGLYRIIASFIQHEYLHGVS